jgi:hypothetical protein
LTTIVIVFTAIGVLAIILLVVLLWDRLGS